jgi:hypothetical protein
MRFEFGNTDAKTFEQRIQLLDFQCIGDLYSRMAIEVEASLMIIYKINANSITIKPIIKQL